MLEGGRLKEGQIRDKGLGEKFWASRESTRRLERGWVDRWPHTLPVY
jgi:hypothetical protein